MGQQQLLLIVLGVIIVGIAVAVGINMFQSSAIDANRNAIVSDLAHLASKAQQYYKKPATLGGGSQDFNGFALNTLDQDNDNGGFRIGDSTFAATAAAKPAVTTANTSVSSAAQTLYIGAYGTETGDDNLTPVHAYAIITGTGFITDVTN